MSNAVPEQLEALRTLIGMAQEEISDTAVDVGADGSAEFQQLCLSHLDNILFVSGQAGMPALNAAAEALQVKLESAGAGLAAEQGMEFSAWLSDVLLYLDNPQDDELLGLLLNPLDEAAQASILSSLVNESTGETEPAEDAFPTGDAQ